MHVGTPILAVGDGEVIVAKYSGAAGNFIAIRHGRQYTTRYMHLRKLLVKPGQKVKEVNALHYQVILDVLPARIFIMNYGLINAQSIH